MTCPQCEQLFNEIARVLGIKPPAIRVPSQDEFEEGCRRYQAELYASQPTDDAEPITREWVVEHFSDQYGRIAIGPHRLFVRSWPEEVDLHCHDVPLTRGQFRQLLAALGWRRE